MSRPAEVWVVTLAAVVIFNLVLGQWGRQWWRNSAMRARQLSESPPPVVRSTAVLDPSHATIGIERAGGYLRDGGRRYTVVIDGQPVGKVAPGMSFAVDVAPGSHAVKLRIDGFGSRRLQVECKADSEVWLHCRPHDISPFGIDDLVLGLIGRRPWIVLERCEPARLESDRGATSNG